MPKYPVIKGRIIDTPIDIILKQLKSELTNGKLKYIDNKKGGWIRVTCPHHSDGLEENPSCGVYNGDDPNIELGTAHCFTCDFAVPLYKFVAECFDKSEEFAKNWLINNFGGDKVDLGVRLGHISLNKRKDEKYIDESILNNFKSWHPYMAKRKLSQDICNRFKVKYDPKSECIVFPTWDEKNNLIMLTKRSVNTKNFYLDKDKEKPIYLMNFIKNNNIKEVTLVESQINCLTLWSWNIPSIATFGCNITQHQFDILNKSGVTHYYLALDGDEAGKKGIKKFINNIRKDVIVDVIELPRGKDVNDLTEEEFNNLKITRSFDWLYNNKNVYYNK